MNAHSPDERLSAFHDGELSAVERAEVERLVTDQPGLQAELSTLTGLSQQLSDLADDLPEVDLRPRVMERIAASRPAISKSGDAPARRRWMPLALLVCSLALLVAAMLPLLPLSSKTNLVADNGRTAPTMEELANSMRDASTETVSPTAVMEADLPGESVVSLDSPEIAAQTASARAGMGEATKAIADSSESADGTGPSDFLARIERRSNLKPGDIVSQLVEGGDVPMIAEYTVIDVRRTAREVEFLLRKHRIVPLLDPDRREDSESTGAGERQAETDSPWEMFKVYLVDAESTSLNTAMFECQNLQEVVALNYEPLGYNAADEAQLAALNGPGASPADAAPAETGSPAAAPAAAMQRSVAPPDHRGASNYVAQGGAAGRPQIPSGPPLAKDLARQADKKMDAVAGVKQQAAPLVNGNSFVIENGNEFYSEVMQFQSLALKNVEQNSPSQQQLNNGGPAIIGRNSPANQALGAISNQNTAQPREVRQGAMGLSGNGISYNNSFYGGRSRQRAILVLRAQSPPPPPEPIRLAP